MKESITTAAADSKPSKSDSLISQFFSKTAQVIVQSRILNSTSTPGLKKNKWFNLELADLDMLKDELRFWKQQLSNGSHPPLIIDILLDISNLKPSHHLIVIDRRSGQSKRLQQDMLMTTDATGKAVRKQKILLETWQLSMAPDFSAQADQVELPTIYKKCIIFFRSLYALVRLMPCYKLCKRMDRPDSKNGPCKIVYRMSSSRVTSPLDAGLDQLHASSDMRMGLTEMDFESLETPLGVFTLHVAYRLDCEFSVDDSEVAIDGMNDLEPHFFSTQRQQSHPASYTSRSSRSSSSLVRDHAAGSLTGRPKEGLYIPNSNFRDASSIQFRKPFQNSPSPDTIFRGDNSSDGNTIPASLASRTSNFPTFTPPTANPLTYQNILGFGKETPPFSTLAVKKASLDKEFIASSPPFALNNTRNDAVPITSQPPTTTRKPSFVFPNSSPNTANFQLPNVSPIVFTPGSSFVHPYFNAAGGGGTGAPFANNARKQDVQNEVEQFLSIIEQSQSIPIQASSSMVSDNESSSKPAKSGAAMNALDRFKELQKDNNEFSRQLEAQMNQSTGMEQNDEAPFSITPQNLESRSFFKDRGYHSAVIHPSSADNLPSRLVFGDVGLSRSESLNKIPPSSVSEDDELLFNMSDLHH